jgi:ubiquinone/menaquinone biosynthesis C-methylase UbiE
MTIVLIANLEHRIADADRLRSSRELAEYKAHCFALVPRATRSLLDLGSATGEDALALAECLGHECQVIGVEVEAGLVDEARRRSRNVALDVHFVVADCLALPFADAKFDVVRSDRVLGGVADLQLALAECARVLRPGGLLIVHDDFIVFEPHLTRAGLTVSSERGVAYGPSTTPTWLLTRSETRKDVRV